MAHTDEQVYRPEPDRTEPVVEPVPKSGQIYSRIPNRRFPQVPVPVPVPVPAISIREQQLVVGTVSQDLETEREDDTATVQVMSPPSESSNGISENDLINCNNDDQELQDKTAKLEANNLKEYLTSYEDFLDLINQQLNKIETELMTAVKFSSLVLEMLIPWVLMPDIVIPRDEQVYRPEPDRTEPVVEPVPKSGQIYSRIPNRRFPQVPVPVPVPVPAISIREQQLVVGTVSQDLETEREDDTATV
ncbi:hypothetical protein LXL04_024280 [Taraxacum kok-saghyz]